MDSATNQHQQSRTISWPNRYDLIIIALPTIFLVAIAAGFTLNLPPSLSVGTGSVLGIAILGDALFRNPPEAIEREGADR
ncbi:MAG: hypothetical protein ABEJ27_05695 [Halodesulfurarchaeum sp.]